MAIISTKGVRFLDILQYPDVEVKEGVVTFLSGESGSGKTTLLRLFNHIYSPSAGTIYYKDKNILDYDPVLLRQEILLVGQNVYLFDTSISENFDTFYGYRDKERITEEEKLRFLHLCSIDFPLDSNCSNMSAGERQRVFLAIHLSLGFEVLLLDEPTSALDYQNAHAFLDNVIAYCKRIGKTLVIISHDREIVQSYAEEVIELMKFERNQRA